MEKIQKDIGKFIRDLRQGAGMTQMKLAAKVGVSYQQIQKYENGKDRLSVPTLKRLSRIFRVPLQAFTESKAPVKKADRFSNLKDDEKAMLKLYRKLPGKRKTNLREMLKFMVRLSAICTILLSVMPLTPLSASVDTVREYCEREMTEIADYCVEQEKAARERIEAGGTDPIILSSCREIQP